MSFRTRLPFIFQNLMILICFFFHINFNMFNLRKKKQRIFQLGLMLNLNIDLQTVAQCLYPASSLMHVFFHLFMFIYISY